MKSRNLLDTVIKATLEGRYEDALVLWSTRQDCASEDCTIKTSGGYCSERCVLPRLLELSLVYNRENAYKAYLDLKGYFGSESYLRLEKSRSAS